MMSSDGFTWRGAAYAKVDVELQAKYLLVFGWESCTRKDEHNESDTPTDRQP